MKLFVSFLDAVVDKIELRIRWFQALKLEYELESTRERIFNEFFSQVLGDLWHPQKHTRAHPTDAYGTIEFQGSAHPTKAQVHD